MVGVDGLPKSMFGYRYYENDTKIEIYDNRNRANFFKDLITNLKKENDSAYTDKADLEAALPDFFKAAGSGYKSYVAIMNQSGTSAPVATIVKNDIGNIVWTRNSSGIYYGTLSGAFTVNKTICIAPNGYDDGYEDNVCTRFYPGRLITHPVIISTQTTNGSYIDTRLNRTCIEIRVYD